MCTTVPRGRNRSRVRKTHDEPPGAELRRSIGTLLIEALPPPGASRAETDAALTRLGRDVDARVSIFGPEGRLLGSLGPPLPAPEAMLSDYRLLAARQRD